VREGTRENVRTSNSEEIRIIKSTWTSHTPPDVGIDRGSESQYVADTTAAEPVCGIGIVLVLCPHWIQIILQRGGVIAKGANGKSVNSFK